MSGPALRSIIIAILVAACLAGTRRGPAASASQADTADSAGARQLFALRTERIIDRDALNAAGVRRPSRLAYGAEGSLYILDAETRRVVKLDPQGKAAFEVGGYGSDEASLELPVDIAVDRNQSLLVLDRGRGSILAFDRAGRFLAARSFQGLAEEEARGVHARLVLDPFGKLWLLAPRARDLLPLDDRLEPARATRFLSPEDSIGNPLLATVQSGGESWVYDAARGALLRFGVSGRLMFQVSLGSPPATDASSLSDIAVDADGHLYAADERGQRLLVFDAYGARVLTRPLGGARVSWRPVALAIGPGGEIAVADAERAEIQILAPVREAKP